MSRRGIERWLARQRWLQWRLRQWANDRVDAAWFKAEFAQFKALAGGDRARFALQWDDRWPCLGERTSTTGFDRHYVYHMAWAARVLADLKPQEHVDIASALWMPAMLSAIFPIRFYDFRPAELPLDGLTSLRGDVTALDLLDNSVASLSCMHVVEHIGLGRYGDPLDPDGDLKAMRELNRVLAPNGDLLFVVPVGQPRVQFNAHRVYAFQQVREAFAGLDLREFALIPDDAADGGLIRHADVALVERQKCACGCFWFHKPNGRE